MHPQICKRFDYETVKCKFNQIKVFNLNANMIIQRNFLNKLLRSSNFNKCTVIITSVKRNFFLTRKPKSIPRKHLSSA